MRLAAGCGAAGRGPPGAGGLAPVCGAASVLVLAAGTEVRGGGFGRCATGGGRGLLAGLGLGGSIFARTDGLRSRKKVQAWTSVGCQIKVSWWITPALNCACSTVMATGPTSWSLASV